MASMGAGMPYGLQSMLKEGYKVGFGRPGRRQSAGGTPSLPPAPTPSQATRPQATRPQATPSHATRA